MMFFEQRAQGFAIKHIDLDAFDTVDFTFAPAADNDFGTRVAQHFGGRKADTRGSTEDDCFLVFKIWHSFLP